MFFKMSSNFNILEVLELILWTQVDLKNGATGLNFGATSNVGRDKNML